MKTRPFSGRQLALLEMLDHVGIEGHISIPEAQTLNQTTFRSALVRGYCTYRSNGANEQRGFHVTAEGREALRVFRSADISRKDPSQPLTSLFHPESFRIGKPKPRNNVRAFLKKGA